METAVPTPPTNPKLPPFPIEELVDIPEGVAITPELLGMADLSTIPRNVTLLTRVGFTKVRISKEGALRVRLIHTVRPDDPLAQIHGVKKVAHAMEYATGLIPKDEGAARRLPSIKVAGWNLLDVVFWEFNLPITATGDELIGAAEASDKFVMAATREVLASGQAN